MNIDVNEKLKLWQKMVKAYGNSKSLPSTPPTLIEYDERPFQDVGTHFEDPNGDKISIVKGWEEGTRIDESTYKQMLEKSNATS